MEKQERDTGHVVNSIKIAEFKYPKSEGWKHVWIFDHSSCHAAMADDSLDVNKMNVNPGGKQRKMRDGFWEGKVQKMNFARDEIIQILQHLQQYIPIKEYAYIPNQYETVKTTNVLINS